MSAKILDGRLLSNQILDRLRVEILQKTRQGARMPGLCTILVGTDPASQIYVRNKIKQAEQIGIRGFHEILPENISEQELLRKIQDANQDPEIDGILVQLPLPRHIRTEIVLQAVDPQKDVDGFHPENVGLLAMGKARFIPCTPKGCMNLIQASGLSLLGCHAVVIGRSPIVGRPMAQLLTNSDATVTVCHHLTHNLSGFTGQADLLISATGVAHLIRKEDIKPGAVVIDVGIHRTKTGQLIGDVDAVGASSVARAITPVPGGVGPMTLAMLMENTWIAYQKTTI